MRHGLAALGLLLAASAHAATFVVDSTMDLPDVRPGDGACAAADGTCTLPAAIDEASSSASASLIHLPPGNFVVGATMALRSDLEMVGVPGETRIFGAISSGSTNLGRLFTAASGIRVTFKSLDLRGGSPDGPLTSDMGGVMTANGADVRFVDCDLSGDGPFTRLIRMNGGTLLLDSCRLTGDASSAPRVMPGAPPLVSGADATVAIVRSSFACVVDPQAEHRSSHVTLDGRGHLIVEASTFTGGSRGISAEAATIDVHDSIFNGVGARSPSNPPSWSLELAGATELARCLVSGGNFGVSLTGSAVVDGLTLQGLSGPALDASASVAMTNVVVSECSDRSVALAPLLSFSGFSTRVSGLLVERCNGEDSSALVELRVGEHDWSSIRIEDSHPAWGDAGIVVRGCRLSLRDASITDCGAPAATAGLHVIGGGSATLANVTIAGNSAGGDDGIIVSEGAVAATHCTIARNVSDHRAGIAVEALGTARLDHVVVAGNAGHDGPADCEGVLDLDGPSWIEAPSCTLRSGASFLHAGDPSLGGLDRDRRARPSCVPLPGSPLIDAGDPTGSFPALDSRGDVRPLDGDGDGIAVRDLGAAEACPQPSSDSDGDGAADSCDSCPLVADDGDDADADGLGDACDPCTDSDADGLDDVRGPARTCPIDLCPGVADPTNADADGDGMGDACDRCPHDDFGDDVDLDLLGEGCDRCPLVFDASNADGDGDGIGDACDTCRTMPFAPQDDQDGDGLGDACDPCPATRGGASDTDADDIGDDCDPCIDVDGDGRGDFEGGMREQTCPRDLCPGIAEAADADADGDRVGDACDDCPLVARPQADRDHDGVGDACDSCPSGADPTDADGDADGVGDACDDCPLNFDPTQSDADFDGLGNACDPCPSLRHSVEIDTDGDGRGDDCDNCPLVASSDFSDRDGDGIGRPCDDCPGRRNPSQADGDGDGAGDDCDTCVSIANADQADADGDRIGDACDNCPSTSNGPQEDADRDGLGDACDDCSEPSALDRSPTRRPLLVGRTATGLALSWESSSGGEFAVYEGTLGALRVGVYDETPAACDLTSATAALTTSSPAAWFVAVKRCDSGQWTSLGRDSSGRERPAPATGCR